MTITSLNIFLIYINFDKSDYILFLYPSGLENLLNMKDQ